MLCLEKKQQTSGYSMKYYIETIDKPLHEVIKIFDNKDGYYHVYDFGVDYPIAKEFVTLIIIRREKDRFYYE